MTTAAAAATTTTTTTFVATGTGSKKKRSRKQKSGEQLEQLQHTTVRMRGFNVLMSHARCL